MLLSGKGEEGRQRGDAHGEIRGGGWGHHVHPRGSTLEIAFSCQPQFCLFTDMLGLGVFGSEMNLLLPGYNLVAFFLGEVCLSAGPQAVR